MRQSFITISALLAALLAGCASPAIHEGAPPATPRHADVPLPDVPLPAWGEAVGSDKLDEWIKVGMAASPAIRAAGRVAEVASARGKAASAGRRPELSVEGDLRFGSMETAMTGGEKRDVETFAGRASAAWDLDIFGKVRSEVGAARFAELSATHRLRDAQVAFAASVADTYVAGRLANERLRLRQEALKAYGSLLGYLSSRVKAGLALPSDLELLEGPRQDAKQKQIAAEQEIAELNAKWRYLVPEDKAPAIDKLGIISTRKLDSPIDGSHLHAFAVNRPDVEAAYALWQEAVLEGKASARGRLPTVSAVAMAESEGPSPTDEPEEWTAWAGARLTLPLLSPDRSASAETGKRKARVQEALFEDTTALAIRDLRTAYARRLHAELKWDTSAVAAKNLKARFDSVERQHRNGRVPVADLEKARLAWLTAAENEIARYAELLRSHIDLLRACGGPEASRSTF